MDEQLSGSLEPALVRTHWGSTWALVPCGTSVGQELWLLQEGLQNDPGTLVTPIFDSSERQPFAGFPSGGFVHAEKSWGERFPKSLQTWQG